MDVITYPCRNFNGCLANPPLMWRHEWNYIPSFDKNVNTCPCHNLNVGLASLCLQKIPLEAFRSSRVCAALDAFIFYIVVTQKLEVQSVLTCSVFQRLIVKCNIHHFDVINTDSTLTYTDIHLLAWRMPSGEWWQLWPRSDSDQHSWELRKWPHRACGNTSPAKFIYIYHCQIYATYIQ